MKGDAYDRLAELQIDKVEVRKDIPTKQLEADATVGAEREQFQEELGGVEERWESDRSQEEDWAKRPLLTSEEWRAVENGYEIAGNSNRVSTQIQHCETIKMAELESQTNRRPMATVGSSESVPSATTGAG